VATTALPALIECETGGHGNSVFMWGFDLIELNGDDLRRDPLVVRKATLASVLARAAPGLRFNEHLDKEDGPLVFWRDRAEEARLLSEEMNDPHSKETMRRIAEDYDRLAERAEERAKLAPR
jgi:ATP-dependent DNA ligase